MPLGPCPTSAGGNPNLHLSRLVTLVINVFICLYKILIRAYGNQCQVRPALPALQRLVHSNDEEVLTDACWALSYLSDGTNDKIQAVIEAGVCHRLVELLM